MGDMLKKIELDLFPTPVSLYNLENVDFSALLDIIDSEQSDAREFHLTPNGKTTFRGSGSNESSILGRQETREIRRELMKCVRDYTERLGIHNIDICESWFNITEPGGSLGLHRHEGSVVSGALYPRLMGDVSPLLFKSPISMYKMNELYRPGTESQHAFGFNTVWPETGILVLFPSWLEHTVDKEVGHRLVVSFNTYYTNEPLE